MKHLMQVIGGDNFRRSHSRSLSKESSSSKCTLVSPSMSSKKQVDEKCPLELNKGKRLMRPPKKRL